MKKLLLILLLIVGCEKSVINKISSNSDFTSYANTDELGNILRIVGNGSPFECYNQNMYRLKDDFVEQSKNSFTYFTNPDSCDVIDCDSTIILAGEDGVEVGIINTGTTIIPENNIPEKTHNIFAPYPNPTNSIINLNVYIPEETNTKILLINTSNTVIDTILNDLLPQGNYIFKIDMPNLVDDSSFYRLIVDFEDVECFANIKYEISNN